MTMVIDEIRVGHTWNDVVPQTIVPTPHLAPITINNAVKIEWPSEIGKTYQPKYSFNTKEWFDFGNPVSGTGEALFFLDSPAGDDRKFYRVEETE